MVEGVLIEQAAFLIQRDDHAFEAVGLHVVLKVPRDVGADLLDALGEGMAGRGLRLYEADPDGAWVTIANSAQAIVTDSPDTVASIGKWRQRWTSGKVSCKPISCY